MLKTSKQMTIEKLKKLYHLKSSIKVKTVNFLYCLFRFLDLIILDMYNKLILMIFRIYFIEHHYLQ